MPTPQKSSLHPQNPFNTRYELENLSEVLPELKPFVFVNQYGNQTLDFADPKAVKALNKALLLKHYDLKYWDIPDGYLCPPIPGRADYLFHINSFLQKKRNGVKIKGDMVNCLDIGTGASCIYPIIGHKEFGWKFVGSEFEFKALNSAQNIINNNASLKEAIELRVQQKSKDIFKGIIKKHEFYDVSICNPPFHASAEEAEKGTIRKLKNLKQYKGEKKPILNFGGKSNELWYEGGELKFITNMVVQSKYFSHSVRWFTTLVSKEFNLKKIYEAIKQAGAKDMETIEMVHGNKKSRIVAWTFLVPVKVSKG
ncbi:23S rRNA (adenine(1618)-N(6))-methyltransferase RlmF [Marivirga arenosa]|uniref:Ribosomal RNA large subunit methyltransferase F n=1 Tax=Marivirga arenosa TaxID=3059076 RepID=A0AA49GD46_9BACT|nr:23S rRNA (adenine(1618)-N(6))-methyltransferase RlmF [Marivirga sp. BKB1-2]WKK81195.2 23S rRNA (adenine(1618)-N(6))-methyltransferase RlmF [Marivirga sp. BKB1-2]